MLHLFQKMSLSLLDNDIPLAEAPLHVSLRLFAPKAGKGTTNDHWYLPCQSQTDAVLSEVPF